MILREDINLVNASEISKAEDQESSTLIDSKQKGSESAGTESNLTDKAAALNSIAFAVGSTVGPPLGGGLYQSIEW